MTAAAGGTRAEALASARTDAVVVTGPVSLSVGSAASVRVPATSANLGPGFDSFGLALDLYDDVSVEVAPTGLAIEVAGEGADAVPRDATHLVVRAFGQALDRMDAVAPGITLRAVNRIPHGRGLGSSAAAICAGILLARQLVASADTARALGADETLQLAAQIEGHPDNVAACLLGGATIAWLDSDSRRARAVRLPVADNLRAALFIPEAESATEAARALLPATVPHADAAVNAARAALLVTAITGRTDLLLTATEDLLHQRYRAASMPESAALVSSLRAVGIAAVISGAGPTVLALTGTAGETERAVTLGPNHWRSTPMAIAHTGAAPA